MVSSKHRNIIADLCVLNIFVIFWLSISYDNAFAKQEAVRLVLFPPVYKQLPDGSYVQKLRLWLAEEEFNTFKRKVITDLAAPAMQLESRKATKEEKNRLLERSKWFFFDALDNQNHSLRISGLPPALARTNRHGHTSIEVPVLASNVNDKPINVTVNLPKEEIEAVSRPSIIIPNTGVSVISDIDDTLRVSNVVSKGELVRSTFLEAYRATTQMPSLLKEYKRAGAHFHYVSASPWQLWPSLEPFMMKYYPNGEVHLRNLSTRIYDRNFYNFLFGSSMQHKKSAIERIFSEYPGHRFILIGDTGECDPEVYGDIVQSQKNRIEKVILRKVPETDFSDKRLQAALSEEGVEKLQLVGEITALGSNSCKDIK